MALIRFSNLVNDIRGSSGGNVFARNRSGAYVRNRTTPLNPQSSPQMATRAAFGALTQAWRSLTQAARDAWNAITPEYPYQNKLGETREYSGEQLFIKLNRNLEQAGLPTIDFPSTPGPVSAVASLTLDADIMTPSFTVEGTLSGGEAEDIIVIQATAPKSPGVSTQDRSQYRNVTTMTVANFLAGQDIVSEYTGIFGSFDTEEGSKIFVRAYGVSGDTGIASAPFQEGTIIVDTTP